jgi:uncharacterized protein involved in exopolysaccharide biosynthesis
MIAKSEKTEAADKAKKATAKSASDSPNNPMLAQVQAKLESVDNGLERLEAARLDIEKQLAELDVRIARTPQVERGIDALERDYKNTLAKYQEMKNKQLQAELSKSLEAEQKGERFTLLEPPLRPDKPVKPDRPKLFMLGLILSMVGGIGVAGVAETVDGGIRGSRALAAITKMTPLVTIPYIVTHRDEMKKKRNLKLLLVVLVILGIGAMVAVHFFYKPLDLLWFIVLRKLNLT